MRLQQEIVLGIGGTRALEQMGYRPSVFHMNEGIRLSPSWKESACS